MKATELTSANFDTTLQSTDRPVLVDFHAEWCGPCRMMGPTVDQLAVEQGEYALITKVNVDHGQDIAQRYRITSIPTVMIFKGGQPVATASGVQSKAGLLGLLQQAG
jgi:thioredoxin 1